MDIGTFRRIAYQSADAYLRYCRENGKGKEIIEVKSIRPQDNKFVLSLGKRISFPDSIVMKIQSPLFPLEIKELKKIVSIVYFTDVPPSVMVKVKPEYYEAFKSLTPNCITFESDFSFLVEAVCKWYHEKSDKITRPLDPLRLDFTEEEGSKITESQKNAIDTALYNPISYIWGAPGTGKTQYVLANCIMEYVKAGNKVLLMAPTNNALEQSARGILRVLKENNIPTTYLYRLGNPTLSFAREFPEVCNSTASDAKIKRLKEEIEALRKENEAYIDFLAVKKNFERFPILEEEYIQLDNEYKSKLDKLHAEQNNVVFYSNKLNALKQTFNLASKDFNSIYNQRHSLMGKIKCFFSSRLTHELNVQIYEIQEKIDSINQEIENTSNILNETTELVKKLDAATKCSQMDRSNSWKKICSIAPCPTENATDINYIRMAFENYLADYADVDFDETVPQTIERKQDELDVYLKEQKEEVFDRYIVACTVDYAFLHYGDFPQDIDKEAVHLFVDEAAYCPMIKAGLFFSYSIPVTFFGDHMQLPPICEMRENEVRESKNNIFLWSQSALYFPEVFLEDSTIEGMLKRFIKNGDIVGDNIVIASLNKTHRFGDNLAQILNKFIYKFDFTGDNETPTKITVINVARSFAETYDKTNVEEIEAIDRYIKRTNLPLNSFAILTPYRKQMYALKKKLGYGIEVSTIHASQGREWDTVILSVVEKNNKFFMDSTNPDSNGLKIINTAISRAKKHLVLVLDYEHWQYFAHEQLIGNLAVNNTEFIDEN